METLELIRRKLIYNDWANRRALESLRVMKSPSSRAARSLAHVLLVEQLWLARLRRDEIKKVPTDSFPELPLTQCESLIEKSLAGYTQYVGTITEAELDVVGNYETLAGSKYVASRRDVLTHVMSHSMYHRGQVALAIREDGGEPLQSDYILYVRETSQSV